jgi:hypothetical protein
MQTKTKLIRLSAPIILATLNNHEVSVAVTQLNRQTIAIKTLRPTCVRIGQQLRDKLGHRTVWSL